MELNEMQRKVEEFVRTKRLKTSIEWRILDLVSEVGELSKEILKGNDYGKRELNLTGNLKLEIGDILFSLVCIANDTGTDLEECLLNTLNKYQNRFEERGHIGSNK